MWWWVGWSCKYDGGVMCDGGAQPSSTIATMSQHVNCTSHQPTCKLLSCNHVCMRSDVILRTLLDQPLILCL